MSLAWAKKIAARLIKNCKDYSEACGGDTHLVEIPNAGPATRIDDQVVIAEHEKYLDEIDSATRIVLPDGIVSDHTLEQRVRHITEVIRNVREAQFAALNPLVVKVSDGDLRVEMGCQLNGLEAVTGQGQPGVINEVVTRH